jgi:hypothetical protein
VRQWTGTYTQLLRQKWVTCSWRGRDTQPGGAPVTTGPGDRVEWILCRQCEEVYDRLYRRLPGEVCPIRPCREVEGKEETRLASLSPTAIYEGRNP